MKRRIIILMRIFEVMRPENMVSMVALCSVFKNIIRCDELKWKGNVELVTG